MKIGWQVCNVLKMLPNTIDINGIGVMLYGIN